MSGKRWLREHERADIARAVAVARAGGAAWKELAAQFGMSARQLQRLLARRVSRETMSQKISEMSHRVACAATRAA